MSLGPRRQLARLAWTAGLLWALAAGVAVAQPSPPGGLARMPIKEVTIFKDGHAFVLHEGRLPTDGSGNVVMDYLPTPVLGTFWAHSADTRARLTAAVARQQRVRIERTALTVRDLIEGNIGAQVIVTEVPAGRDQPLTYLATIVGVPERSGEELDRTGPPNSGEKLPQRGNVVLLKTEAGTRALPIDRILDVTFKGAPRPTVANEELRNLLTLRLDWENNRPEKDAAVGMVYLQKGLRWIPSYKVNLDGKGSAVIKLEATLVNELADMTDVTAQLVVGVPTFAFKDMIDPLALQQALARVASTVDQSALTGSRFSNAIMSQVVAPVSAEGRGGAEPPPAADLGPELAGSQRNEDLFVYTVKHVTLRKGERMVLPVHEVTVKYRDLYTVEIPFALPPEIGRDELRINDEQQRDLARLLREPNAVHKVRLSNRSSYPFTTAPALIFRDGRVLAQGLMTYTAVGADGDLPITQAVEIGVKKADKELRRVPNAETWQGRPYGRIDLAGTITVTNRRDQPVELEVVRYTLGRVTEAGSGGKPEMVNIVEDRALGDRIPWWPWYSWPDWMLHFNGMGKVTWTLTLQPGASADLTYAWNYFWR